jgi:hypothetical protein
LAEKSRGIETIEVSSFSVLKARRKKIENNYVYSIHVTSKSDRRNGRPPDIVRLLATDFCRPKQVRTKFLCQSLHSWIGDARTTLLLHKLCSAMATDE